MTAQQAQLQAAIALHGAAHKRLQAAIKETSEARVLTRLLTPRPEWTFQAQTEWVRKQNERYSLAVLTEAKALASYERAFDRLNDAQEADNRAHAVEPAGPGELQDVIERARR